jgi:hypothetical protein
LRLFKGFFGVLGKGKEAVNSKAPLQIRYGHVIMVKLPGYPNWPAKVRRQARKNIFVIFVF